MKSREESRKCERALYDWLDLSMQLSLGSYIHFFREKGFSHSQMATIHMMYHRRDCTVSNVSRMLSISNPAASQLLDQLVRQGFVERFESGNDRRVRHHRLTREGLQMMKNTRSVMRGWYKTLIEGLSEDELNTTNEALEILNSKIQPLVPPCRRYRRGHWEGGSGD